MLLITELPETENDAFIGIEQIPTTRKAVECFVCGKVHTGDCVLGGECRSNQENRRDEHQSRNICDLCGKFSPNSETHNECADIEQMLADQFNEAEAAR